VLPAAHYAFCIPLVEAGQIRSDIACFVEYNASVQSMENMAVRCGKYYFARSHGLSSALITSYLCDIVLLSSIPFVQALGHVLLLRGMSGFPQYGWFHRRASLPSLILAARRRPFCLIAEKINNVKAKIQGNPPPTNNPSSSLASRLRTTGLFRLHHLTSFAPLSDMINNVKAKIPDKEG
jgi:hypothetical protein